MPDEDTLSGYPFYIHATLNTHTVHVRTFRMKNLGRRYGLKGAKPGPRTWGFPP